MVNYFCPPLSWIADSNRVGVPLMRVAIACDRPDTPPCTRGTTISESGPSLGLGLRQTFRGRRRGRELSASAEWRLSH
jgi:hypothetical protein